MSSPLRLVVALAGAVFALQGAAWWLVPARAAEGLGMPLLDGLGRSTQVGDFGAFFLTAGITMLLGSRPGRSSLLLAPAILFALAALGRTLAWALHGADFAALFIGIELAMAALLVAAARALGGGVPADARA
jgi:hypothetical protein